MSELRIEATVIDEVIPHPNADNLDLLRLGAYTVCEPKGKYTIGQIVAHFPPDMLIPNVLATQLGVANYLKDAIYPGDVYKSKCRVAAIRLRGCPSFGFVLATKWAYTPGEDMTPRFHGVKYEQPDPVWWATSQPEKGDPRFHIYTDIQSYRNSKYTDAIPEGVEVRITEKIHGTNSRVGVLEGNFMCGSHKCPVKELDSKGNSSLFWGPLNAGLATNNLRDMLLCLSEGGDTVIAFGEIFGSKVQCMDYGIAGNNGYRLYDISVNGRYLDWQQVEYYTQRFCVPTVPLLYRGPFSHELVAKFVDGPTTIVPSDSIKSKFKGREGIVITPLTESFSPSLGGRIDRKSVV